MTVRFSLNYFWFFNYQLYIIFRTLMKIMQLRLRTLINIMDYNSVVFQKIKDHYYAMRYTKLLMEIDFHKKD